MLLLTDIVAYVENLCVQHPALQHAAGSEVFEVGETDDFGQFRGQIKAKSFAVRLLLPSGITLENEGGGNALKIYEVGILVAKSHGGRKDRAAIVAAIADSEQVADDFVERIVSDARRGHPLFSGRIEQPADVRMSQALLLSVGDNTYSGVEMFLKFAVYRRMKSNCTTGGSVGWLDGGLTSFTL